MNFLPLSEDTEVNSSKTRPIMSLIRGHTGALTR
jgi:hypothetical protein